MPLIKFRFRKRNEIWNKIFRTSCSRDIFMALRHKRAGLLLFNLI